jgi:hypothetical protein
MKGASAVQAGAGAAATVLAYLYPDRAAAVDELAERGRPRVALELGRSIGARVIARGRRDGSDAGFQGTIRVGPGLWVPTPSAFAPTLEASQGRGDRGTSPRVHGFVPALRRRSEAGATPERCARSTTSRGRSPSQLARDTGGMRSLVSSFGPLKGRVDELVTEREYIRPFALCGTLKKRRADIVLAPVTMRSRDELSARLAATHRVDIVAGWTGNGRPRPR